MKSRSTSRDRMTSAWSYGGYQRPISSKAFNPVATLLVGNKRILRRWIIFPRQRKWRATRHVDTATLGDCAWEGDRDDESSKHHLVCGVSHMIADKIWRLGTVHCDHISLSAHERQKRTGTFCWHLTPGARAHTHKKIIAHLNKTFTTLCILQQALQNIS